MIAGTFCDLVHHTYKGNFKRKQKNVFCIFIFRVYHYSSYTIVLMISAHQEINLPLQRQATHVNLSSYTTFKFNWLFFLHYIVSSKF